MKTLTFKDFVSQNNLNYSSTQGRAYKLKILQNPQTRLCKLKPITPLQQKVLMDDKLWRGTHTLPKSFWDFFDIYEYESMGFDADKYKIWVLENHNSIYTPQQRNYEERMKEIENITGNLSVYEVAELGMISVDAVRGRAKRLGILPNEVYGMYLFTKEESQLILDRRLHRSTKVKSFWNQFNLEEYMKSGEVQLSMEWD